MNRLLLVSVVILAVTGGCIPLLPVLALDTGTVVFNGFEGGFYGIVGDNGDRWDVSPPSEFMVDGLRVRFAVVATDQASFHMWGRTANLLSIERLE